MKEIRFRSHMAKSGHKGISRIDSEQKKMHGWYVRVRFNNETRSKFVTDRQHGDKEAALKAAVECRDTLERALGKPPREGAADVRRARRRQVGRRALEGLRRLTTLCRATARDKGSVSPDAP